MQLRNRQGRAVDPVPFLVVTLLGFLIVYSFGPPYLGALGLAIDHGVALSTGVFLAIAAAAYHRLVWSYRPDRRRAVPGGVRFGTLYYGILVLGALCVLLSLPLLVR
ncbi:hypothetical protein [Halostella litorea]|uniref:hypothetical protein n=1 Tax=Halostella litorea TaxID=2528831 RepID=UPI001091F265|nr:hypothetical protein [Halostella litorea]